MYPKNPPRLLLLFFFLLTFFVSCFGSFQESPVSHVVKDGTVNGFTAIHGKINNALKLSFSSFSKLARQQASSPTSSTKIVNVEDFGAKADGTDASEAFKKAWEEACSSEESAIIVVPKNKIYYLKPVKFSGPCQSDLIFKIYGTIKASVKMRDYEKDRRHWIVFDNVENLRVKGGGTINGNGKMWWDNSCKIDKSKPCIGAPTAVTFSDCKNLIVANLWFQNAQQMHLTFQKCKNVRALNLIVTAPGKSPNTDGIHVTSTQNIRIRNCVIRTGDDCLSIESGSKNVEATDIVCGPGHGISIGSLGDGNSEAEVSNVLVNRATLSGTTNGVRIKTWQGGSGFAKNIVFQNIVMNNVTNPIIIDQNYCDQDDPCPEQKSAVQVSNVVYKSIKGTSASETAMKFDCSKTFPCQGILLQDVALGNQRVDNAKASCANVNLSSRGKVYPQC
ncbi:polygalacturonase QRT2 [Ricinus communis]|uniref:endo-polygalacturonase n=1 Tax=Ricinus communis TaxID=3988 RepID=B9RVQ4_RICCO|nr:polygalacturonase QRT2 [Ricinus communis]EEF44630.1 Polygalacturonase precursor, putative [Ricinus communis]|eukprot:XP_002517823.1 polygalacturonase QRT2 [Ricinus communis]